MRGKALTMCCVALGLTSVCWGQIQDVSQQFISARAGMVNYVDGNPRVFRGEKAPMPVLVRDQLRPGERVELGDSERLELLLNPGSYLRVAGKAELEVVRTSFQDMQFALSQGKAIVESSVFDKKTHAFQMRTPAGDVNLLESGLYRFEVDSPQGVIVSVSKGQAKWVRDGKEIATLKSGKRFILSASSGKNVQSAKLDKDQMDDFDLWSKRRAEFLVAANSRMSYWGRESVAMAYLGYGYPGYPGYPGYNYMGGWGYNPFYNCYTFVPFGSSFVSPYGFAYMNFYPMYGGYYGGYGGGGRSSSPGGNGNQGSHSTSTQTRSTTSSAPAAPSSRMDTGHSDTSSRSSVHSQIHR